MLYRNICLDEIKRLRKKSVFLGYKEIPDSIPYRLNNCRNIPNWKQIAISILQNDFGKRKKSKYYSILKRIEMDSRENKKDKQLKLF